MEHSATTLQRLKTLKPGEHFVYFTGHLDADRQINTQAAEISLVADEAYRLMKTGRVHLTQRRLASPSSVTLSSREIGVGFQYIATGASPSKAPMQIGNAFAEWR